MNQSSSPVALSRIAPHHHSNRHCSLPNYHTCTQAASERRDSEQRASERTPVSIHVNSVPPDEGERERPLSSTATSLASDLLLLFQPQAFENRQVLKNISILCLPQLIVIKSENMMVLHHRELTSLILAQSYPIYPHFHLHPTHHPHRIPKAVPTFTTIATATATTPQTTKMPSIR